jgi:hypothetical protein
MIADEPLLVTLLKLVDRIPHPPEPTKRGRGRPKVYSDRLFLKALVITLVERLSEVYELLCVLEQPTAEMRTRLLLPLPLAAEDGRYPSRRTFERRLKAMPETLPAQIACLGRELVESIEPWALVAGGRRRRRARYCEPGAWCGTRKTGRRARRLTPL